MKIYLRLIRYAKFSWTIVGEMVGESSSDAKLRLMVKKCFGCDSRGLDVDVFKTLKMDIVVDIKCGKDYKNRAIPKEVAVLSLDQNFAGHWIVSPNRQITTLCQEARKENDWLSQNNSSY